VYIVYTAQDTHQFILGHTTVVFHHSFTLLGWKLPFTNSNSTNGLISWTLISVQWLLFVWVSLLL